MPPPVCVGVSVRRSPSLRGCPRVGCLLQSSGLVFGCVVADGLHVLGSLGFAASAFSVAFAYVPGDLGGSVFGGQRSASHRVTLGITALGCGFPPARHLQLGLLFNLSHLHHLSQVHHLSSVSLGFGGACWVGGALVVGAPLRGFALGDDSCNSLVRVLGGGHSLPPSLSGGSRPFRSSLGPSIPPGLLLVHLSILLAPWP